MILVLLVSPLLIWWHKNSQRSTQKVQLFFADSTYRFIRHEIRLVDARLALTSQIKQTLFWLIQGPSHHKLRPLLPFKTKLLAFWFVEPTLYLNFSKELFLLQNSKVKHPEQLLFSVLASLFYSFPQIRTVHFFMENRPLKTFSGLDVFLPAYTQEWFFEHNPYFFQQPYYAHMPKVSY